MKLLHITPGSVEPWLDTLSREGWVHGFGMEVTNGRITDMLLQEKMDWCRAQFGPATSFLRSHHFSNRDWSRYGQWFLFIDQDMAFEFRMRWC